MRRMIELIFATQALTLAVPAAAQTIWQAGGGGGSPYVPAAPAYGTGLWFPPGPGFLQTGSAGTVGSVYMEPAYIAQSVTIDQVGVVVSTAGATGSQAVVYVYGSNAAGNSPSGLPLGQCTITGVTATGFQSCTFGSPIALTGNKVYWFGWEINATATALVAGAMNSANLYGLSIVGAASLTVNGGVSSTAAKITKVFGNAAHTFGTASNPATYSPAMSDSFGQSRTPMVYFHVSSVP